MGTIDDETRRGFVSASELYEKYDEAIDRDSAYEFMERYRIEQQEAAELKAQQDAEEKQKAAEAKLAEKEKKAAEKRKNAATKSVVSSASGSIGREIGKSVGGLFGSFGKKVGGNIGASLGRGLAGTLFKK
jgi:septal ring factor EnvC (AmiA/AmiB activator)